MSTPRAGTSRARWVFGLQDARTWPETLSRLWRRSLRFRTLVITIVLTAFAILVACVWMALAIQDDLFASRRDQALEDAQRATLSAQTTLNAAEAEGDSAKVSNVMSNVRTILARQAGTGMIAVLRTDTAPSSLAPQSFTSGGLLDSDISPEMRARVQSNAELQWWQSIPVLQSNGDETAGIVVGQQLDLPGVGAYELYLAYDFSAAQNTLGFVQGILWLVGMVLVVLIGGISWFVLRSVTIPIGEAAQTSAKLAAGDLKVRIGVHGDDELATLGRSFNAMADSIESQIKELAELSLVQQRFVSDVSHELRTPLTTIRLAADMLNDRRSEFDPATSRAAELMHAQVERFEVLLTDLLEISRYDAGSVQLELEPTALAHLAEDVVESMHQLAEQHGSDIRVVAPGGYSPVDMDPRRVRRVVRNLLGNAIEHGEGRPIVLTIDSNQDAVALGVRDYGLGMSPDEVERVFDRFWRADPSRTRTIGGTGLGLSIALGDAHLHGGTLAVWSQLGRGTNFVLTLPRHGHHTVGTPPITPDPGEEAMSFDDLGLTQPIELPSRPQEES
ncbi:two-component system sensor histidine kinase MtrB [Microbacterium endophyticum]|uniref:Sensor histidine kinase MtrB n=1 Tax=Microbacterium endophyticum TaxID=1526412 RepID=A0A7W4V4D4_9MICO|nr:MtrAB system histidine kinase MtrB [Microbacterium endophyticum]MBB2976309.1 two-component system sensor histidine kinase MtrB [Microbacterium endophyticum]NIK35189.1 two-component system sensor histidine kinase MtrB [Microbacterium endophyticum]